MQKDKSLGELKGVYYVKSRLGVEIKILRIGWENISVHKHPELKNKFSDLMDALIKPNEVWQSKADKSVYLYYWKLENKYFCVICKHYNRKGFLITAYYTHKVQGARKIWPKK